jgi:hypothetical protein
LRVVGAREVISRKIEFPGIDLEVWQDIVEKFGAFIKAAGTNTADAWIRYCLRRKLRVFSAFQYERSNGTGLRVPGRNLRGSVVSFGTGA